MLYSRIAALLEEVSLAPRSQKSSLTSEFLIGIEPGMICPAVRLIYGELWPPWEEREMGIGPESILAALEEVSGVDVLAIREDLSEIGKVCEVALQHKVQHPLTREPLQALSVYNGLRRVSQMNGPDSERRKGVVLKGLFLSALPHEGKYIARTALRSMLTGIGPQTMMAALSKTFNSDKGEIQRAYNAMPEMGLVARAAQDGALKQIKIQSGRPVRPMIIRPGALATPRAFLPKYAGLKVQRHVASGGCSVFTSHQKNITSALSGLIQQLGALRDDLIVDADLIGFRDGGVCSQVEMIKYINHRRLTRKSIISPALIAYELIYLNGEDLTGLSYQERRRRLLGAFGEPKSMPFLGISPAEERVLNDEGEVRAYCLQAKRLGCTGLIMRDLGAPYRPGVCSDRDFIVMRLDGAWEDPDEQEEIRTG
ncbi:MAG TPA: hypothetical protein PKV83_02975 [Methanothrix sp.]|nr:hypothetical protein [Methanothrix sp.]